jgi:hypothetical protein
VSLNFVRGVKRTKWIGEGSKIDYSFANNVDSIHVLKNQIKELVDYCICNLLEVSQSIKRSPSTLHALNVCKQTRDFKLHGNTCIQLK